MRSGNGCGVVTGGAQPIAKRFLVVNLAMALAIALQWRARDVCQLITMLPTSVSPNVIVGGYRSHVTSSQAKGFAGIVAEAS